MICVNGHKILDTDEDFIELGCGGLLCTPCVDKLSEVRPTEDHLDKNGRFKGGNKTPTKTPFSNSFYFPGKA